MYAIESGHLDADIALLERQSQLTGNCGRSVRRTLEEMLPEGKGRFNLTFKQKATGLHLMYFVNRLKRACDLACAMADGVSFEVTSVNDGVHQNIEFTCNALVPDGVKDRQSLMKDISYGLREIAGATDLCVFVDEDTLIENIFFDAETTDQQRIEYAAMANLLLGGDLSRLAETPAALVRMVVDVLAISFENGVQQDHSKLISSLLA